MQMDMMTANLEQGMPTAQTAKQRMSQALRSAKAARVPAVKLIHGYGSSGRGGVIRTEIRRELDSMLRQGSIRLYVRGEEFSPFYPDARAAVDRVPSLTCDRDYARTNQGITIVIL